MLTVVRRKPSFAESPQAKGHDILDGYPDLLNVDAMREITGLCAATIRNECSNGRLPAVRIGRRWYVSKSLFIEYVNGGVYGR